MTKEIPAFNHALLSHNVAPITDAGSPQ